MIRDKTENMKPCPWGKGHKLFADTWHGGGPDKHLVGCQDDKCHVNPQVQGNTLVGAVRRWNKRGRNA